MSTVRNADDTSLQWKKLLIDGFNNVRKRQCTDIQWNTALHIGK